MLSSTELSRNYGRTLQKSHATEFVSVIHFDGVSILDADPLWDYTSH